MFQNQPLGIYKHGLFSFLHYFVTWPSGLMINLNWCSSSQFLTGNICVQALTGTDQPRITNSPVAFIQQLITYFSTDAALQLFKKFCVQNLESEWSLPSPFILNFWIELLFSQSYQHFLYNFYNFLNYDWLNNHFGK